MNVLLLTHTFSDKIIGGEARISWELSLSLAKRDLNIFVVSPYVEKNIEKKLPKNLKVYKVPFCHSSSGLDASNMLRAFFYSLPIVFLKKIDIIHLISSNGPCLFSRFKFGRKFVESADISHDYENPKIKNELWEDRSKKRETESIPYNPGFFEKAFDKFTNLLYKVFGLKEAYPSDTDLFACRAMAVITFLRDKKHKAELVYIPNGVNIIDFNLQTPQVLKNDKFTFLFCGKLTKTKGILYLIEAFKRIKKNHSNVSLILVGDGVQSTVKDFKDVASNEKDIIFSGVKSPNEIKNYYNSCDVFVLPSLSEGFGIVNLEAMACGKPVISTRVGGIIDVVIDGKTGLLVDPANIDELYLAMNKFLENPNLAIEMGKEGRKRVVENFSWDIIAEKLDNAYKAILKHEK